MVLVLLHKLSQLSTHSGQVLVEEQGFELGHKMSDIAGDGIYWLSVVNGLTRATGYALDVRQSLTVGHLSRQIRSFQQRASLVF